MSGRNFRKGREKRVKALIDRGYATGDEMIEAQFGEMPNGLEQTRSLTDIITFHKISEDMKSSGFGAIGNMLGYGHIQPGEEEKRIYINRFMNNWPGRIASLVIGRMALARVHDLLEVGADSISPEAGLYGVGLGTAATVATIFSSFRFAFASSFIKAFSSSRANTAAQEFIHTLEHKNEEQSWAINNAFRANSEDMMSRVPHKWADRMRKIDGAITMMPTGYYQADSEIMARMFLLAIRGYDQYGKIPENPEETWGMLGDMGVVHSNKTQKYFEEQNFRERYFRHKYSGLGFPPAAEINLGVNAYRRVEVLEMYWKDAFPIMMAELHYLLGDENAFGKFGYDAYHRDLKGVPRPFRPEEDYHDPDSAEPSVK